MLIPYRIDRGPLDGLLWSIYYFSNLSEQEKEELKQYPNYTEDDCIVKVSGPSAELDPVLWK